MVKEKKTINRNYFKPAILLRFFLMGIILGTIFLGISLSFYFEKKYQDKIYPGVRIDGVNFGNNKKEDVEKYFIKRNEPLSKIAIVLSFEDRIATLSGKELNVYYDGNLSSTQAYLIGRSGHFFSDIYQKWQAVTAGINLPSLLTYNNDLIDETLDNLGRSIDIPPQNALFQFENGKVTLFKLSKDGRRLNKQQTKQLINSYINEISKQENANPEPVTFNLLVETVQPQISTENSNKFGIKEILGKGTSKFAGSIPGRIHNVELAASKVNGQLVPPGETFSFNNAVGDISAATGFQPAYIIKEGRTVLGDGGGVCQVSTTLFRAALNAGLQITERQAHAYRVGYYEQDSSPGIDATVFAPSVDLKIKNNTANYILIQSKTDTTNLTLEFEIFGTSDGRKVEITKPVIYSQSPPPPDLYQDDPTLPKGVIKQVDWKASGAKTSFDYQVTNNGQTLSKETFVSNYKAWQSVYLRGTKE